MKNTRSILSLLVIAVVFTTSITVSEAHAFLDKASPAVGSEVKSSPAEVKIWYTEGVEPSFSTITVSNSSGTQVDKKDTHLDGNQKAVLVVSLPSLPPGTYKVAWSVIAEDTHHTQGGFSFTVKP